MKTRSITLELGPPHKTGATSPLVAVAAVASAAEIVNESAIPIFDRADIMERLMDDEELIRIAIDSFLEDIPQQITALQEFIKTGDAIGVELKAHTIKGASANLSAERLRKTAGQIEHAARTGDLAAAQAQLADLNVQFEALRVAVLQEFRTPTLFVDGMERNTPSRSEI